MDNLQSTPVSRRTLPSKGLVTQSNYSPRTLENTRNRFAGLFTAFGVANDVTASPKLKSSSLVPRLFRPDLSASLDQDASRKLPTRAPIPAFQLSENGRGPASAGPSRVIHQPWDVPSRTEPLIKSSEPQSSFSGGKFWSFLSPSPARGERKLSPASSIRRRLQEKGMSTKSKGSEVDDDDEEWDEACFVDLEESLDQLGVAEETPGNALLPLPDEIMMLIIQSLPPSLALQQTLSVTCKSLAALAASQYLWRRLYLSNPGWCLPKLSQDDIINYKELYKTRLSLSRQWLYDAEKAASSGQPATQRMQLISHTDSVYAAQFSRQWLISGSRDRSIKLWKLPPLGSRWSDTDDVAQPLVTVDAAHDGSVLCLQFEERSRLIADDDACGGRDYGFLATGSSDNTISLWRIDWDARDGPCINKKASLKGHTAGVLDLALTENLIISASKDTTVKVWSRSSHECILTLREHTGPVNDVAVNQSESQMASVSGDGRLIIWNLVTGEVIKIIAGGERGVACVRWSGNYLLVGSNDRSMKLYHAGSGDLVRTFKGHDDLVRTVAFDVNVGVAVSGSYDKTIRIWNLRTGALLRVIPAHESLIFGVRIDTSRIVSISHDRTIVVQQLGVGLPHLDLCI